MFTTLLARIVDAAAEALSMTDSIRQRYTREKAPLPTMGIRERVRYNKALTAETAGEPLFLDEPIGVALGNDPASTAVPNAPCIIAIPTTTNTIELLAVRHTEQAPVVPAIPLSHITVNDLFRACVDTDEELTVTNDRTGATWTIIHGATIIPR